MRLALPRRALTMLGPDQVRAVERLCGVDPLAGVMLVSQLRRWQAWGRGDVIGLAAPAGLRVGGERRDPPGRAGLTAAAWSTGSLMPFGLGPRSQAGLPGADPWQLRALAEHSGRRLTSHGSVFGALVDVEPVWSVLEAGGTRSREERWRQPVLVAPDPAGGLAQQMVRRRPGSRWAASGVRAAGAGETELLEPAATAMFRGEVGDDPLATPGQAASFRSHLRWLVEHRRSYVLLDDAAGAPPHRGGPAVVAFKADVGALWADPGGPAVAQLTGVWTRPDLRGRGIGAAALAAVVDAVRRDHLGGAGTVSLYVNDFNLPALALYRSLGFTRAGTFATVLL